MDLPENAVENAVAKLEGIAEELMRKSGIPAMAVAVVHGGKTVYAKGFGVKDVRSGEKVDPDTVFQLASVSKPLAATVVAHQVGVNAIGWDTPIVSKLPWFALSDPAVTQMVNVGDTINIRVYEQESISTRVKIRSDGRVEMPFVGELQVAGKQPFAVAR